MTPRRLGLITVVLSAFACGGTDAGGTDPAGQTPVLMALSLSLSASTVEVGQTATATASGFDQNGAVIAVGAITWATTAASIAIVSSAGLVTGIAPGQASVVASVGGKETRRTISVIPAAVGQVTVSPSSVSLTVGATQQLTAVTRDTRGGELVGRAITWTTSDGSKASVSATGLVTAHSVGTATITATSEGQSGSISVVATVPPPPPGVFTLNSPANGNALVSTTPTLQWNAASGATSYAVEVATSATFGSSTVSSLTGLTATSVALSAPLTVGIIYYWRVTAVNAGGSTVASGTPRWFSSPYSVGASPAGVAVTPDGLRALVTNTTTGGTVTLVSLASHSVAGTIPVGARPSGIAITPNGSEALVTNSNSVSVINLASNTVTRTITAPCVGTTLYDIAITPDGARAVMPDVSAGCTQEGLDIINFATGAITFVNLNTSGVAYGVAVTPNGTLALVTTNVVTNTIKTVNLQTMAVATIPGTSSSFGVAISVDNTTALVTSNGSDNVKRISLTTNAVVATIPFASNQHFRNVAISPDGTRAVVVGDFDTAIVSLSDNTIVATYPTGGGNVVITPDGKIALVTNPFNGKLCVMRIP